MTNRVNLSQTNRTCPCDNGYYDDTTNMNCLQCDYTCFICTGPTENDCSQCHNPVTHFRK